MVDQAVALSLLHKLGDFTRTLGPSERELFAALIGPGVENAIGRDEVEGFAAGGQESDRLVRALAELTRRHQPAVEGDAGTESTGENS